LLPLCPQGKQRSGFTLAPHEKTVYPRATAHVFQPDPEISPLTRAAWDHHPDWATLRDSIVAGAASAAKYGYPWDEAAHVKHVTSIWEHNRFLAAEKLKPPLLWTAQLIDMDYNERVYCRQRHLSDKALRKSWSSSHQETLIEQILEVLQISGVGPLGLSQQFETQRDSSSKVIYVEGGWLCSFVFKVTSSRFELKEDFSSLDIRVCPKSLLEKLRRDVLPIIFQPFTTAGPQEHDDVLLAALRSIAADPSHGSSGWLGNFSLDQMDHLESLFEPHGRVPWDELINPLWNELLSYVEDAWLALYSRFIGPDEERLPLPFKLVDSADSPSSGGHTSDAPPCATAPPPPTLPILTLALDCASSGSTSVRVDEGTGLSLALQSRLQRSPGYRRRNPLSCVRIPNTPRDKGSPAAVSPSLRRSVFYPAATPVALLLAAAPRFFFDCALYATLICLLSPPLDASAWAEIPLALVGDIVAY